MATPRNHFDSIAEAYDETIPPHVRDHYLRKRVKVLGPMLDGGTGLDVGCGTGVLIDALKPHGNLTGVDASEGMIQVLRGAGRGKAAVAESDRLPFADDRFDVVFCVAMLHHVADRERVAATLREMVRVARKPGGRVVVWDHNPANPYWPIIMKRAPQDTGEERLVPADEIVAVLRESGARDVRVTQSGFVPDFVPRFLLPVARIAESVLEHLPLIRRLGAHNIVIATL